MKKLQPVIKRDIYDLFKSGLNCEEWYGEYATLQYHYSGKLDEIEFLSRLYDLRKLPSTDIRYPNAYFDVRKHTLEDDDYQQGWVFKDTRFGLEEGSDEDYLKFLCEIFHPEVRDEGKQWKVFLNRVNELINENGYIICPVKKTANRNIYGWKTYNPEESDQFVPFSQRYAQELKTKKIKFSLSKKFRNQAYQILVEFDDKVSFTNDTGYNCNKDLSILVFEEISKFYQPKAFVEKNLYKETRNLENFICNNYPEFVFDYIEFFNTNFEDLKFESRINQAFEINHIDYRLKDGEILMISELPLAEPVVQIELGLQELLQEAVNYYKKGDRAIATEKLWDAFERLKTYYSKLGKKTSVTKIIDEISLGIPKLNEVLTEEFLTLTNVGNNFRIRHHETTVTDIPDDKYYKYFFRRCHALIELALDSIAK